MTHKVTHILILSLITLISCGKNSGQSYQTSQSLAPVTGAASLDAPLQKYTTFAHGDEEYELIVNMCQAFKYMRMVLPSGTLNKKYLLKVSEKNCDGKSVSNNIEAKLHGSGAIFESSYSGNYFQNIPTDINGVLKNICTPALKNQPVANQEFLSYNSMLQFQFKKVNSWDYRATVTRADRDNNGLFYTSEVTEYDVKIVSAPDNTNLIPSLRGLTTTANYTKRCTDQSKVYELSSVLLDIVPI